MELSPNALFITVKIDCLYCTVQHLYVQYRDTLCQRVCTRTSKGEMGGGDSSSMSNWTELTPAVYNPCEYDGWGMPGQRAGSPVSVYVRVHCREPKTGQQMVQFYCKDDWLLPSCYYLSMLFVLVHCTTYIFLYSIYIVQHLQLYLALKGIQA